MAFRFRKSIKLAPGVRLNLSKSGIGVSAGVKGARIGANSRGTYTSVGIPGTGVSSLQYHGKSKGNGRSTPSSSAPENYTLTSQFGDITVSHSPRGIAKFELEISHDGLNKYQILKGDSQEIVEQKASTKMAQWDEIWGRKQIAEAKRNARQSQASAAKSVIGDPWIYP